jgi:hypothetical protein
MTKNNVWLSFKKRCHYLHFGNDMKILNCWNGCIGPDLCDTELAIPIDIDWCILNGTINTNFNRTEIFECVKNNTNLVVDKTICD